MFLFASLTQGRPGEGLEEDPSDLSLVSPHTSSVASTAPAPKTALPVHLPVVTSIASCVWSLTLSPWSAGLELKQVSLGTESAPGVLSAADPA